MKRTIKIFGLLCAMTLGITLWSCEDPHTANMDEYMSLVNFRNGGEQTFTFAEVDEQFSYYVSVCKTGFDPSITAEATLAPMDEAQIEMYNLRVGTNFKMVPQDYYKIKGSNTKNIKSISFGANEGYKVAELAFLDSHELAVFVEECAAEGKTPVVGLQLYSDTRLPDDMNYTLLTPELEVANVLFTNASMKNEFLAGDPVKNKLSGEIRMNIDNMWNFECDIEVPTDPAELETLIARVNELYGSPEDLKIYSLIPDGCYWFNAEAYTDDNAVRETSKHVVFSHGVTIIPFDIYVDRYFKNYVQGEEGSPLYVLPLKITNVTNDGIHIDENNGYYLMALSQEMVYIGLDEIELSNDMIVDVFGTEPSEGSVEALVDGNEETYWHSLWSDALPVEDSRFGAYIDFKLAAPLQYFQFSYCSRHSNGNAVPTLVTIGVSDDGENWTVARENIPCEEVAARTWFTLPMVTADKAYSYVRFGVTKSKLGDLTSELNQNNCTALAEITLAGSAIEPKYQAVYDESDLQ